jgi:hypothetical protein
MHTIVLPGLLNLHTIQSQGFTMNTLNPKALNP